MAKQPQGAAVAAPADTEYTEQHGSAAPQVPRFFFDVLPLHPRPEPLESLTSYMARLAELNGIREDSRMLAICFPGRTYKASGERADALPVALDDLAALAACSPDMMRATTFAHLRERFGRPAAGGTTRGSGGDQFLRGSIARHLRYCPRCLEGGRYYRLTWRFPWLTGCPAHGRRLLERCGHCDRPLPLFATPLNVGMCPRCGGDLRRCATEPLTSTDMRVAARREDDLVALLAPPVGTLDAGYPDLVGQRLAAARLASRCTGTDIARTLGVPRGAIDGIERALLGKGGAAFRHYLAYAAHLDLDLAPATPPPVILPGPIPGERISPRMLLDMAGVPRAQREEALAHAVVVASGELRAAQRPLTRAAVADHLGVNVSSLQRYPRVRAVFAAESGRLRDEREGVVVAQVRQQLARLADGGRGLTQPELAAAIGLSLWTIRQYPAALVLLPPPPAGGRMPRRLPGRAPVAPGSGGEQVPWRESADELRALYDAATDDTARRRLHALWLVRCGTAMHEAAARSGIGRSTLINWLSWYRIWGLDAVLQRTPGKYARRAALQLEPVVRRELVERARVGAFLNYADASAWLWDEHGVVSTHQGVFRLLDRLGVRLSSQPEVGGSTPSLWIVDSE